MNRFSIVTVVRNDLQGLKKSRESLDEQLYKNWVHIIIDGGSTDGTTEFIKSLPKTNTISVSEPDTGIYNAMNKAWKLSERDNFVYYLNARDKFASEKSLKYADMALSTFPLARWGCTTHEEINQNGEGWVCKLVSPPSVANQLYAFGYRSHQGVVMKASFIEYLGGFNEDYQIAADWDLIVRALISEEPVQWAYPIGIFELGGESSVRILKAHQELKKLRKIYLTFSWSDHIFDDIWSALYLRNFGYRNYLTSLINALYPQRKENNRSKNLQNISKKIRRFKRNSNKQTILGAFLGFLWRILELNNKARRYFGLNNKVRRYFHAFILKKLKLKAYERPEDPLIRI